MRPLSPALWAVSSGSGSVYILETTPATDPTVSGELIARYDLPSESKSEPSPFLLHAAHSVSQTDCRLLLTRSIIPSTSDTGKLRTRTTAFELLEVSIDPTKCNPVDDTESEPLQVRWSLRSGDLPFWCSWSNDGWLVLSGEEYRIHGLDGADGVEDSEEARLKKEQDESVGRFGVWASIPIGNDAGTAQVDNDEPPEEKQYPYSWTQTPESLSVSIPFPAGTKRSDLAIGIMTDSLSLSISLPKPDFPPAPLSAFLKSRTRQFWATIDLASSTMTYDAAKSTLVLDLVKVDADIRWPGVFAASDDDNDEEDDVPETISASTFAAVRETLNSIRTREPGEPEGNHPAIPALLREEMDFGLEDDEDFGEVSEGALADTGGGGKVGREVLVGFVKDGIATWFKAPTSILSTPLSDSSVILKSAIDGLVFTPAESGDPSKTPWSHISTSPALAFVLSSKRDLRVVRHLTSSIGTTVLAFDAGSSTTAAGNVYVYYPPTSGTSAKQGVVGISGAERGALLGVGRVEVQGRQVVVALCEKELVILRGVV